MSIMNQSLIEMVGTNEENVKERLLENLDGYMVFDKERLVEAGATQASMSTLGLRLREKIEDILGLKEQRKITF